jgi:N-acetylneuraminic acid mutarotase
MWMVEACSGLPSLWAITQKGLLLALWLQRASGIPQENGDDPKYCWKELAPIRGGPRQEHSTAALDRNVYIFGGFQQSPTGATSLTKTVEVYNVDNNTWSTAAPLPTAMHHLNVATVNGKIYVLGGITGVAGWQSVPNAYRYDPVANTWTALPAMPAGTGRGSAVVGVRGQNIYLAGGIQSRPGASRKAVTTVSSYDTISGNWSEVPPLPEARDHAGGMFIGEQFYVVGGRVALPTNFRGTVYAHNLHSDVWIQRSKMPTARGGIAAAAIGTKIYTFGGEGNPQSGTRGVFPDIESFDVSANVWEKETRMRTPRHGMAAVAIGDTVYIPGGGAAQGMTMGSVLAINEGYGPRFC